MKILVLSNNNRGLLSFRRELIESLILKGYEVVISSPSDDLDKEIINIGAKFINTIIARRSTNPFKDLVLLFKYISIIKKIQPDIVLSYTIKPNLYGGIACRICKVDQIANITGLGSAVENKSIIQKFLFILYRIGLKNTKRVFLQNTSNLDFCLEHNLIPNRYTLIPGSGVNLERFQMKNYPIANIIRFIFISRIMKEKGIEQYLDAAIIIKAKYPNTEFHILGFCEDNYTNKLKELTEKGIVIYHGKTSDVRPFIEKSHCTIHPTYYPEGMSNVLLESCAMGRPIITTDRSGCREIVDNGINGFVVKQRDSNDLIEKIEKFINLSQQKRINMGLEARNKVERMFNRKIVIDSYLKEIEKNINYLKI